MITLSDDILLDLPAVVARTGLSARTWRRIIAAGKVGVCRIQGSVRIPKASLEAYLTSCFSPPREARKDSTPRQVAEVIDAVLPRKRRVAI
jgi:hypothetical protein